MDRALRLSLSILWLSFAFLWTPVHPAAAQERPPVGIFLSSKIRPYLQALHGVESAIAYDYQVFDLSENFELARHYARSGRFRTCLAIGPEAIRLLYQYGSSIPNKMAIMALDLEKIIGGLQICGIDLRIPIDFQMRVLKQRFGMNRKVAILYNSDENGPLMKKARRAAKENGLDLMELEVDTSAEIMGKLETVFDDIDLILFVPDSVVVSEKIVTHITKTALLKGVGVVGFNRFFHESGALLSFIIDYEEVGRQAASLLKKMIEEDQCVFARPKVHLLWNERALEILVRTRPDRWKEVRIPEGEERR